MSTLPKRRFYNKSLLKIQQYKSKKEEGESIFPMLYHQQYVLTKIRKHAKKLKNVFHIHGENQLVESNFYMDNILDLLKTYFISNYYKYIFV